LKKEAVQIQMTLFPEIDGRCESSPRPESDNVIFVETENLEGIFLKGRLLLVRKKLLPFDVCEALGIPYARLRVSGGRIEEELRKSKMPTI
jgi:hypothetical protein